MKPTMAAVSWLKNPSNLYLFSQEQSSDLVRCWRPSSISNIEYV